MNFEVEKIGIAVISKEIKKACLQGKFYLDYALPRSCNIDYIIQYFQRRGYFISKYEGKIGEKVYNPNFVYISILWGLNTERKK